MEEVHQDVVWIGVYELYKEVGQTLIVFSESLESER